MPRVCRVSATKKQLEELEARVLRKVATALRGAYDRGYYGMGGPQDGDDTPSSFDAPKAASELEAEAAKLEKETA